MKITMLLGESLSFGLSVVEWKDMGGCGTMNLSVGAHDDFIPH
jgi:hypothetical protein